jgi:hypothetical protein
VLLKRRVAFHVYPDSACRSVFRHRHARLSAHLWNFVRTCLHHLGKEGDAGWPRNPTPIKSQPTPRSDRYPCIVITGTLSGRISLPFCARSPQNVRHASSPHADRGGTRPWRPWRDDRGGTDGMLPLSKSFYRISKHPVCPAFVQSSLEHRRFRILPPMSGCFQGLACLATRRLRG